MAYKGMFKLQIDYSGSTASKGGAVRSKLYSYHPEHNGDSYHEI